MSGDDKDKIFKATAAVPGWFEEIIIGRLCNY